MKKMILIVSMLAFAMTGFAGCASEFNVSHEEIEALNQKIDELNEQIEIMESRISSNALNEAFLIMELLRDEDWNSLATYAHPVYGVRFSPYQHVSAAGDLVMTGAQIAAYQSNSDVLNWGIFDGIGDPIELDPQGYYDRFIYDQDFLSAPVIGNNCVVSYGNTINNISEIYNSAVFVEFYYPEIDPQYAGMDWRSLTLVLEKLEDKYYLVGIVHGEWTI